MKFAVLMGSVAALALGACEIHPRPEGEAQAKAPAARPSGPANEEAAQTVAATENTPVLDIPPAPPSASPLAKPVDSAVYADAADSVEAKRDMLIRAQVLLDRAHVSPGVID